MAEQQDFRLEAPVLPDQSLILVAVMPSPRDMEIARVLGWYRIPYRFAPKIVYVDYLAFYQPAAFGLGHQHCIEVIAPVRGVELTTRREIFRDEPHHPRADEEYFKIQIGSLMALSQPIQAGKWKRITFLYTTGERLISARIINELVVQDEERKVIWRSLRERQAQFSVKNFSPVELDDLDAQILAMLSGLQGLSGINDGVYEED